MIEAVLLMLLTGVVWAGVGILFRGAPSEKERLYPFFAVGNIVFAALALAMRPPSPAPAGEVLRLSALIVPSSLMEAIAFLLLKRAMERGSQGVAWSVAQSAMAIPFLCLVVFLQNPSSAAQWAGLVLVLAGLLLFGREKPEGGPVRSAAFILLALASFVLLGVGQFMRLVPGYSGFSLETMTWRLPLHALAAAIFWVAACFARRVWWPGAAWRRAVPYGVVAALGEACFYLAADAADRFLLTSIVMPMSVGTCILLFALYCRLFLGERLSPGGWTAVVLNILGITLLSCGAELGG